MLSLFFYFGCVGLFMSASLIGPIMIGLLAGETDVSQRLVVHLVLGTFLYGGMVLATMGRQARMPQISRLVLLTLVWTALPIGAAIPIADITELSVFDSLFESFSGITTAGFSVITTVETIPQAMVFWRVQLQWIGGYLALLSVILIVAPLRIGGLTSRAGLGLTGDNSMKSRRRIESFVINIGYVYVFMTAVCTMGLLLAGTRPFYALTLSMTAVSTGGFLPFDRSIDEVVPAAGMFIMAAFLLLGATSVFWQSMWINGKVAQLTRHRESYSVIAAIALLTVIYGLRLIALESDTEAGVGPAIIEGFFAAASLVATSGIESRPGVIPLVPLVIVLLVIFIGGSAYSTSGGLKHYRVGGMVVQSFGEVDRLVYPSAVISSRFGARDYDLVLMKAIWSFFVALVLTIIVGTIVMASLGLPFEAALTAVISAVSTAGPVYDSGWTPPGTPDWPTIASLGDPAKLCLIVAMILGRLELLAVFGLFSARYWSSR